MKIIQIRNRITFTLFTTAVLIIIISAGCARRMDVKREWPAPLKINPAIIKQCNLIHNNTCPLNNGVMTDAVYYFDKRKLPSIESDIKKNINSPKNGSAYEDLLNIKKIESASAYSATFTRTECSIEYYVQGINVTCEKFLNYLDKLKNECDNCLEIIKVDPADSSTKYTGNSTEKLFFE